jgi:hypothetical protein
MYAQRSGKPSRAVEQLLAEEERIGIASVDYYQDFATRVRSVQRSLTALLQSLKANGKRIAAYAVSAKGAILLNSSGIGTELVDFVVDRNRHKHGKYMPGVHLCVHDTPKLLEPPIPDYLLLLAWNFKDEIMLQQQEYRRRGGKFIIPIPDPHVAAEPLAALG